jgi:hypothetical protein
MTTQDRRELLVQTKPYSGIVTPPAESNKDPAAWRGVPRLTGRDPFTLDGEVVVLHDGVAVFEALHRRCQVSDAISPCARTQAYSALFCTASTGPAMLGFSRHQTKVPSQLIREYIYLYGAVSEGRHLRLFDHADIQYGMLSGLSRRPVAQVRQTGYPCNLPDRLSPSQ